MRQFAMSHAVWEAAVDAVAELDALMSLAAVADVFSIHGPMCRPKLVEPCGDQQVSACITCRPRTGCHYTVTGNKVADAPVNRQTLYAVGVGWLTCLWSPG